MPVLIPVGPHDSHGTGGGALDGSGQGWGGLNHPSKAGDGLGRGTGQFILEGVNQRWFVVRDGDALCVL